jgi:septal ring factor EnvC (AmiA/AmiB activator)
MHKTKARLQFTPHMRRPQARLVFFNGVLMKRSIYPAEALPSNLEKLEKNIRKLQQIAEELEAQIKNTESEVHSTEKDIGALGRITDEDLKQKRSRADKAANTTDQGVTGARSKRPA